MVKLGTKEVEMEEKVIKISSFEYQRKIMEMAKLIYLVGGKRISKKENKAETFESILDADNSLEKLLEVQDAA